MRHPAPCVTATALLTCALAFAQPASLNLAEDIGPEPRSATWVFPLHLTEAPTKLYFEAAADLTAGQLNLRLVDPSGAVLREETTQGELQIHTTLPVELSGTVQLEMTTDQALGHWKARLYPLETAAASSQLLFSGAGMLLVAVAGVLYWRNRSRARWAWFWVGAAVWSVGVTLKFAWIPLNKPILHALNQALPAPAYLPCASIYIGLLTGIFEIGVTLAAARIWRQWAADATRAIAIGLGAGAFEALLLGLVTLAWAAALRGEVLSDEKAGQIVGASLLTPMPWLAGPVERAIAILVHTSSRTLTLLTVATGRWRYFWCGFALMTAIDAVAGYAHLAGTLAARSAWWIELAIAPAAILSIPILFWCVHHWPATAAATSPEAGAPAVCSE
jgi:uncharacterized membrane protein YhfC